MKNKRVLLYLLKVLVSIWIICFVVFGLKERFSELHAIILITSSMILFILEIIVENNQFRKWKK